MDRRFHLMATAAALLMGRSDAAAAPSTPVQISKTPKAELSEEDRTDMARFGVSEAEFRYMSNDFERIMENRHGVRDLADASSTKYVDDLIDDTEIKGSSGHYTFKWAGSTTTEGACSVKTTNSGVNTNTAGEVLRRRRLNTVHTMSVQIDMGVSATDVDCPSGTDTTECGASGKFLFYTAEAICKTATSEYYYDDDDEKPTPYPTSVPTYPTPEPTISKSPTATSPTMSPLPTTSPPTGVPSKMPTPAPHNPTMVPTSYPTNPDESAYCTVAKFTCAINPSKVFPKSDGLAYGLLKPIDNIGYKIYLLMKSYYGNTVAKQLTTYSTGTTANWWSDLKVTASSKCWFYYAGTKLSYASTCTKKQSSDNDDTFEVVGGIWGFSGIIVGIVLLCAGGITCFLCFSGACGDEPCGSCCGGGEEAGVATGVDPNANSGTGSGGTGWDPNNPDGVSSADVKPEME